MTELSAAPMLGQGYYNRHSDLQRGIASLGLPWLAQAAAQAALPEAGLVLLADFGCATGANSLTPLDVALHELRARTDRPVAVLHQDRPENDFGTLHRLLASDERSYLRRHRDAYAWTAAGSFYDALLPRRALSLGWTSSTVHWLSVVPAPLPDHLWSPSSQSPARRLWAAQAAHDWRAFLDARAAELLPGGQLVLCIPASDADGRAGAEELLERARRGLQDMVAEGLVTPAEAEALAIPTWYRTLAEIGVDHPDLAWRGLELHLLPDPYPPLHPQGGERLAAAYVDYLRAAIEPSLATALSADRPHKERHHLLQEFFTRFQRHIVDDPMDVHADRQVAVAWLARR